MPFIHILVCCRSGMYEVDGVSYRLFQHIHRPVISSQLQVPYNEDTSTCPIASAT